MALLAVNPELLASAAAELNNLGSTLTTAQRAAAGPTTGLAAAAEDEVSAAVAALFDRYGREYQLLSLRADAFGRQLTQSLDSAAEAYATAEAQSASSLLDVPRDVNLLIARELGIYDLRTSPGWTDFLLDYTWGLPGTTLGYGLQLANHFQPSAVYDPTLSALVGFHVYHGGVNLPGFTSTLGNVTTGLGTGAKAVDLLVNHEALHVWQSRTFGPLFPTSYVGWMIGGAVVGTGYWMVHPDQNWYSLVETAAYYDNPWEVWAYVNDGNWPPPRANPALLWQLPG